MKLLPSIRIAALFLVATLAGCSDCRHKVPVPTGVRVQVKNAAGVPVLSRVAVFQAQAGAGFAAPVTEAWAQAASTGTIVPLAPGEYVVRAQGTGDSFLEGKATVKKDELADVTLGFATLVLDGAGVTAQGRVRVWQKREGGGEQIIVTRLVRPGEQAPLELGAGKYRVGFLPEGKTDEDANFKPFGGDIELAAGAQVSVKVTP
jgi:hypothetical protein